MMTSIRFEQVELSGVRWVAMPDWEAVRDWRNVPAPGDQVRLKNDLDERDPLLIEAIDVRVVERLWANDGSVLVRVNARPWWQDVTNR